MPRVTITDEISARAAWQKFYGASSEFFHHWEVREIFYREFKPRLHFLLAENSADSNVASAFLPLVYSAETENYVYFPGELWHGKTWVEQNQIFAADNFAFASLIEDLDAPLYLRYLRAENVPTDLAETFAEDEINYRFYPEDYAFDFSAYWRNFSGKTRAKFSKEIDALTSAGADFRYQRRDDVQWLITQNLQAFGEDSYFYDSRFRVAFENLIAYLAEKNFLKITSVIVGNETAAVDVGAIIDRRYTVIAGGVERKFPGVAKFINFQHLKFANDERLRSVDFLCGDFGWKDRFRFTGRPLYKFNRE